ncbi:orotate phosphoribosyltransferase [bacterium]|nr:orotate phosphoribosyltransferase [bacterium]
MPELEDNTAALPDAVHDLMQESGALTHGHFALTSGRHSSVYFQAMRLLENPAWADRLAGEVAERLPSGKIDVVFSPAVGGIPWCDAMARQVKALRAFFAERVDGKMTLRRGFAIEPGQRVLLCEDVVTTGGSVLELKAIAEAAGAEVVGIALVLDRSGGVFRPGVPVTSWAALQIPTWSAEECPLCRAGQPTQKPGSRGLTAPRSSG